MMHYDRWAGHIADVDFVTSESRVPQTHEVVGYQTLVHPLHGPGPTVIIVRRKKSSFRKLRRKP